MDTGNVTCNGDVSNLSIKFIDLPSPGLNSILIGPYSTRHRAYFMEQQTQRRLAAVLAADVAGYTRLMRADEEGTMNTWWSYRREIVDPVIEEYSGRIVKLTGDGFLVEFVSANNAVQAAYKIQKKIESRVKDIPENRQMRFRIGVNLGDILWDDEDIYGDDVNIAARLEGLADPGSILISQAVFDKVKRTSLLTFENQGEHSLKNIPEPVQTYRVVGEILNHSCMTGNSEGTLDPKNESINPCSVAVLPFTVFGDDPEQEFFADGFTEDLITEISRFKNLFITSRSASFALKDQNLDLREIGTKLGVAYCVEGSVRKMGDRVRITSQLISTQSGDHIWAEKYDCNFDDLFDVQDELSRSIVSMVAGRVELEALTSARKKTPADMYAYECLLRGLEHHRLGGVTRENCKKALYWINLAIEKDSEYGRAYAWRACALSAQDEWTGEDHWDECVADTQRALELDDTDAESHRLRGSIAFYERDLKKVEYHFQRARELNPNNPWILGKIADLHIFLGDGNKALELQSEAKLLDPFLPVYIREVEVVAHYVLGNYQNAVTMVSELLHKTIRIHGYLVASLSHLDDEQAMQDAANELLVAMPDFSVGNFLKTEFYEDDKFPNQLIADFKKAGLN